MLETGACEDSGATKRRGRKRQWITDRMEDGPSARNC